MSLLLQALDRVAREKHARVFVQYRIQHPHDPSPANTVASMFDVSPANVRQIDRRIRLRLGELVATDPTFSPLAEIPWVEAC